MNCPHRHPRSHSKKALEETRNLHTVSGCDKTKRFFRSPRLVYPTHGASGEVRGPILTLPELAKSSQFLKGKCTATGSSLRSSGSSKLGEATICLGKFLRAGQPSHENAARIPHEAR
jgi:hypothetical protein